MRTPYLTVLSLPSIFLFFNTRLLRQRLAKELDFKWSNKIITWMLLLLLNPSQREKVTLCVCLGAGYRHVYLEGMEEASVFVHIAVNDITGKVGTTEEMLEKNVFPLFFTVNLV